ncbi:MAG: hypothetical protein KJO79_06105, partial [Verrucomicrobiae bacterium]|nr:hypothetical protein [Verrucomicrobiae bacterium]
LNDGEDYELLFTVGESQVDSLMVAWVEQFPELKLSDIGTLTDAGTGLVSESTGGWEHFSR